MPSELEMIKAEAALALFAAIRNVDIGDIEKARTLFFIAEKMAYVAHTYAFDTIRSKWCGPILD